MWDDVATQLMGMSAAAFNDLSQSKFKEVASMILDKPMNVKMYVYNRIHSFEFPAFTIKEASFVL